MFGPLCDWVQRSDSWPLWARQSDCLQDARRSTLDARCTSQAGPLMGCDNENCDQLAGFFGNFESISLHANCLHAFGCRIWWVVFERGSLLFDSSGRMKCERYKTELWKPFGKAFGKTGSSLCQIKTWSATRWLEPTVKTHRSIGLIFGRPERY